MGLNNNKFIKAFENCNYIFELLPYTYTYFLKTNNNM